MNNKFNPGDAIQVAWAATANVSRTPQKVWKDGLFISYNARGFCRVKIRTKMGIEERSVSLSRVRVPVGAWTWIE